MKKRERVEENGRVTHRSNVWMMGGWIGDGCVDLVDVWMDG